MDVLIEIYGTPKEIVVGEITEEQYEYWKEREQGYGDSPSLADYCLKKDDYEIDEEYDFILDDWTDLNDVYFSTGFIQDEDTDEIEIQFSYDGKEPEILQTKLGQIKTSIELDEPEISSFHFIGNETYEKQLCFSGILEANTFFAGSYQLGLLFHRDIIYDQKVITGVSFMSPNNHEQPILNKTKINSSVIDQKFYVKP